MIEDRSSFVAQVIRLYLDDPNTPPVPSSADWEIARDLYNRGVPFDTVRLAFQLTLLRRRLRTSPGPLPPIRSLAYFRTVILNLTRDERDPAYANYINDYYHRQIHLLTDENRAPQPESGGSS